jgi:hypothetical protein
MSDSNPKKIGGEIGEVRANIDVEKLNAYLDKYVDVVKCPVEVKQFKVRVCFVSSVVRILKDGCSLDR